jgi:hypothetical protein
MIIRPVTVKLFRADGQTDMERPTAALSTALQPHLGTRYTVTVGTLSRHEYRLITTKTQTDGWPRDQLVSLTFWHRSFTFNSNKSPTWCNNFSVYYCDVCLQLNRFRALSHPSSGAQWLQWQPLILRSYRGDSHAVFVVGPAGRPARPRTQHECQNNKHQDNKLKNCWIWLVIYLNRTMMYGLTNLKFYI